MVGSPWAVCEIVFCAVIFLANILNKISKKIIFVSIQFVVEAMQFFLTVDWGKVGNVAHKIPPHNTPKSSKSLDRCELTGIRQP